MPELNLRKKFLIPTIAFIVIGMSIVTLISYYVSKDAIREATIGQITLVAEALSRQIKGWEEDLKEDLLLFSKNETLKQVLLTQGQSEEIIHSSNKLQAEYVNNYSIYDIVGLVDLEGNLLASSKPDYIGRLNISDREYFRKALMGETVISEPLLGKSSNLTIIVIATPIQIDGKIAGVFFGSIDLRQFSKQFVDPITVGNEGYAFVVSGEGMLVAHPDKSLIMKLDLKQEAFAREMLANKNGVISYNFRGVDKVVGYRSGSSSGMIVAVTANDNDIFSTISNVRTINIIVTVVMILLAGIGIYLIMNRIVCKPVEKTLAMIQELGKGHLGARLNLKQKDEIGLMGKSLDGLADYLQNVVIASMRRIANGDVTMELESQSEQDEITPALKTMISMIRNLDDEMTTLIHAAIEGKLYARGDSSKFHGAYKELVEGVNNLTEKLVGHLDAIPTPTMIVDKEFDVRFLNRAGRELAGVGIGEVTEKKCFELFQTDVCQKRGCSCQEIPVSGAINSGETTACPLGKELSVAYTGVPVKDMNNQIVGVLEMFIDQTEIKSAQRIIQEMLRFQELEIKKLSAFLKTMASGDMTTRYLVGETNEDTEKIGSSFREISQALDETQTNLSKIFTEIKDNSYELSRSSDEMSSISSQLASGAEELRNQSNSVAGTTEQISGNMGNISDTAEKMSFNAKEVSDTASRMSSNMGAVTSSVEDMSTAIREIAKHSDEGRGISNEALERSKTASANMSVLGKSIKEIDEVTGVIKQIADKTNLLALNATIEAASAGVAGKGFAVVANEIKELAKQSSNATENITKKIQGVQHSTEESIRFIDSIFETIGQMNDSSQKITESVNQHLQAAYQISENIQEADTGVESIAKSIADVAYGTDHMSMNVDETAKGARDVAKNMISVDQAANETSAGAQQVSSSAASLATIATELNKLVSWFKVGS